VKLERSARSTDPGSSSKIQLVLRLTLKAQMYADRFAVSMSD